MRQLHDNKSRALCGCHGIGEKELEVFLRNGRYYLRRAKGTGPQDSPEKRKAVLKWLPPIPVNIDQGEIVPTVHKV